jgi:D-alanyl-D-alanine carboxypeptidase
MIADSRRYALPAVLAATLLSLPGSSMPLAEETREFALSSDSARLALVLDSIRNSLGATGASAAILYNDGSMWVGTSGHSWANAPVTPATAFDIGSITKPFTAALILRLVETDRLELDDPVSKWRRDFNAPGVTIRHLLAQTSGIPDYTANPEFLPAIRARMAGPWSPAENLAFVTPRRGRPDSAWSYSSTNYVLLGLIAAEAGEHSYSELLRQHILNPLQLRTTFVAGEDSILAPRAHAYLDFTGDGKPDDLSALVPDPATTRGSGGAGAIVATAQDVARFSRAYFSGSLVGVPLHQQATRWRDRGSGLRYGFGIIAFPQEGDTLLGHMGNAAGHSAGVWHSAASGITAVILTNAHGLPMSAAVQRLLNEAIELRK